MDLDESRIHSFVIRVWVEEFDELSQRVVWRGHITHVQNRERRLIKSLPEVTAFIAPYLAQMGVRPSWCQQLRHWLQGHS